MPAIATGPPSQAGVAAIAGSDRQATSSARISRISIARQIGFRADPRQPGNALPTLRFPVSMRLPSILALTLALTLACSPEPTEPPRPAPSSPTAPPAPSPSPPPARPKPAPSPTSDIPLALQPISFEDAERADLIGAGCTWSDRDDDRTLFIAYQDKGALKVGDRMVMMKADPTSPPLAFATRRRFVGEGIVVHVEPTGPQRQSGYETMSRPATLSIGADGIDMTPRPGTLSCGS